ncbi:BICD family-like cargo adapter 1 [Brienomyrus brachyistius]|uniref:BICD family-like cargo adapter 1 n=1 Tax=Brienomyrus brachyistius TaxID=42636 RepID=UPI0020B23B6B|nr:BICD family-like cargo adapter 1 [Brienomyrus brachyistius]
MDQWTLKSHGMDLEEEFYSFDFDAGELSVYQDPAELLIALKQKEEEVILAAELGKALLLENRQLKEESDKLHEQYTDKLEELEQGRHELQLKLTSCQAEQGTQVAELESDVQELNAQVKQLTRALNQAKRDEKRAQEELSEQTRCFQERLENATAGEQMLLAKLQAVKQKLWEKENVQLQDEQLQRTMREQVPQKEQAQERHLEAIYRENEELRESLATLNAHLVLQEQRAEQQRQQLEEAQQEAEAARGQSQQLQAQLEELQEKMSPPGATETSLLCELETSVAAKAWALDKEQVTQELLSMLRKLLPLTDQGRSPDEDSRGPDDGLLAILLYLKRVVRDQAYGARLQNMNLSLVAEMSDPSENPGSVEDLLAQNAELKEEVTELKLHIENNQQVALVQQAIRDRDEAIAKKNAMEEELFRSKNDLMSLNNQLLEAIQRKLELSQELEAWQDDIQVILNQQILTQQQTEQPQRKPAINPLAFLRRPSAPTLTLRRASTFWLASEPGPERVHVPWKDWLKRGKTA